MASSASKLGEILNLPEKALGINIYKGEITGADVGTLKQLGYDALQKLSENSVIVLASRNDEDSKVFMMVAVTDDLISGKGLKAGALVGKLGRLVGGGGGGQSNLATAGGKAPEKLPDALEKVVQVITESL